MCRARFTVSRSRSRSKRKRGRARPATAAPRAPAPEVDVERLRDIDSLLARAIAFWSLVTVAAMATYMVAVFAGYPFPGAIDGARAVFYVAVGVLLVVAATFITFLAYRLVSARIVTRGRTLYTLFLPAVMLLSSIIAILLLAAPS